MTPLTRTTPFPTSSSLETMVQSHIIFLLRASGLCVVLLEKRDYNKMSASILIDGATTLKTFIFQKYKNTRS